MNEPNNTHTFEFTGLSLNVSAWHTNAPIQRDKSTKRTNEQRKHTEINDPPFQRVVYGIISPIRFYIIILFEILFPFSVAHSVPVYITVHHKMTQNISTITNIGDLRIDDHYEAGKAQTHTRQDLSQVRHSRKITKDETNRNQNEQHIANWLLYLVWLFCRCQSWMCWGPLRIYSSEQLYMFGCWRTFSYFCFFCSRREQWKAKEQNKIVKIIIIDWRMWMMIN